MLHIVHKGVDFVGEHIGHFKVGGVIDQRAVLGGIQGEFAAILQANALSQVCMARMKRSRSGVGVLSGFR